MVMMRLRAPSTALSLKLNLMFETIQRLEHFLRTATAIPKFCFGGDPKPGDPPNVCTVWANATAAGRLSG